jgi:RNA polymerase sigma factor (sigma-70 family)
LGAVLQAEQRSRLGQLFARLDEERQELIRLRYGAGLTHRQVGEVLGRSEAAVAMALHRTLHWFQQNWEAQDE